MRFKGELGGLAWAVVAIMGLPACSTVSSAASTVTSGVTSGASAVASTVSSAVPKIDVSREVPEGPLGFMYGEWIGEASGTGPDGKPYTVQQTERVGPMLGGDVIVVEGRGYDDSGELTFNALGLISQNGDAWEMRAFNDGRVGTFPMDVREDGYSWSLPAGPNAKIVYTATFTPGTWAQTGVYTPNSGVSRQIFEMNLERVGNTDWPAANYVVPIFYGTQADEDSQR